MIPQEKRPAVFRGLHDSFGTTTLEDIRMLPKGLNQDLDFRIVVRGSPYLLRIMTRIDEMMHPGRIFTCMGVAADAGLTPCVRYSNAEDGISITDFVEAVAFPPAQALVELPGLMRRLHALPPFPKAFNYVTAHSGFIWRFRKAGLLPKTELDYAFARYEQVCAAYPRVDSDIVSCHMDLRPENIVFDGHRVWLVGWQAALLNDRYFDLAVAANFVVTNDADEWTYLEQYFGQRPDEYQRARFLLMCQVLHMFTAAVFLLLGAADKPISQSEDPPSFRDFHRRIWAGEVNLADGEMKIAYGRVHWEQLLKNAGQTRFDEALRIVSDRHAGPDGTNRLLPTAA